MSKTEIAVFGTFTAKNGHQEDLKAVLAAMAGEAKNDPGCLRFDLLQNPENDNVFMFAEVRENEAAVAAHLNMPYLPKYREQRAPFVAAGPEVTKWEIVA